MLPWFFYWCPQWHFPFSGAVNQDIAPAAWFGAIRPPVGDGAIEKLVSEEVASYGRQLGILSDVVLAIADPTALPRDQAESALASLRQIHAQVAAIKARQHEADLGRAQATLARLAQDDPAALARLIQPYAS